MNLLNKYQEIIVVYLGKILKYSKQNKKCGL